MTSPQRTGARAALETMGFLLEVGCSANSLAESDFGFDLHAQLPEEPPEPALKRWTLSANTVVVQVKGSSRDVKQVEISPARWRLYQRSPTPVYIAGLPVGGASTPWLAAVETLASWESRRRGREVQIVERPAHGLAWDASRFLEDAHARAALGSAEPRCWWQSTLPGDRKEIGHWLHRLAGLSLLLDGLAPEQFTRKARTLAEQLATDLVSLFHEPSGSSDGIRLRDELAGGDALHDLLYNGAANPPDIPDALKLEGVARALGGLDAAVAGGYSWLLEETGER